MHIFCFVPGVYPPTCNGHSKGSFFFILHTYHKNIFFLSRFKWMIAGLFFSVYSFLSFVIILCAFLGSRLSFYLTRTHARTPAPSPSIFLSFVLLYFSQHSSFSCLRPLCSCYFLPSLRGCSHWYSFQAVFLLVL